MSNENIVKVSFLLASYSLLGESTNYSDLFIVVGTGIWLGYLYQTGLKQIATFNKNILEQIYMPDYL